MRQFTFSVSVLSLWLLFSQISMADYFLSAGHRIYYSDNQASGQSVVLVHGFGMDSSMWHNADFYNYLDSNYRVISIDLRGHGQSDKPTSVDEYGPNIGLDIVRLLDQLKIESSHMIGFSMGSYMIARLLVTHPERIKSAVLVSGFFPGNSKQEKKFQEHIAEDMLAHGELALAAVAKGWAYDAVTKKQVSAIVVPLQFVFGSEELDDFYHSQKAMLELPRNSQPIKVIAGADHDSQKAAILHLELRSIIIDFYRALKPEL
ncbi:alpha/beta hydrolase [uncultured Pseudoteredinibacter sp.]|uniref:alpha/beta fold hydrolase n=1 Tax=uncultured Pseudoteredinibacter sp. TaxID=1641701 RepID=UPI0026079390|nr:alpha/beta hydrolase [uncultured Pseudoteredinibacter sp.]